MHESRRCEKADRAAEANGYVETDPTSRYGRFEEVLGKGATKTVYRAFDELNGIEVAWNQAKLSDVLRSPEALQRMYSEVELLSSLHHDSIIRFHASWIDVGKRTFNFITEMFTSGTLRGYRQRYRRVDIRAIKNWARQILHGLVYLHSHDPPVIHRDLKCDNIFVNGHLGQVKIGDLGLAAVLRGSQSAHSVIGTPEFMAPELYEEDYNELVDVYSYGMCVLEMVTSEYPYSECSNPAQIYKKVTSGKLPDAFFRVQNPEARRFIGRCLETVSKRSSAKELLLDPFLATYDHRSPPPSLKAEDSHSEEVHDGSPTLRRTDMTITGKMNPEDDTIILKVQIGDKKGEVRNIYFPFDIVTDTPLDVANEMVKELEITDREPSEIGEMIAEQISILVPGWKESGPSSECHHVYDYGDEEEDGLRHPFYDLSSPASSQGSVYGLGILQGVFSHGHRPNQGEWLRDEFFPDDDDLSSMHSGKYSAVNYCSGNEQESEPSSHEREAQPNPRSHKPARLTFGPDQESGAADASPADKFQKQRSVLPDRFQACCSRGGRGRRPVDDRHLMRNRSMVDVRSQLLHRALVEELNKRLFKTVGAVENIGFQMPSDGSRRASSSSSPSSSQGDCRKHKKGFELF